MTYQYQSPRPAIVQGLRVAEQRLHALERENQRLRGHLRRVLDETGFDLTPPRDRAAERRRAVLGEAVAEHIRSRTRG